MSARLDHVKIEKEFVVNVERAEFTQIVSEFDGINPLELAKLTESSNILARKLQLFKLSIEDKKSISLAIKEIKKILNSELSTSDECICPLP